MNLSYLSILFTILLLASCSNSTIPSIPEDSDFITASVEEQLSTCNTKYLHLLDNVERMRVLAEEEQEQVQRSAVTLAVDRITPQEHGDFLKNIAAANNHQLELVNEVYKETSKLLHRQQAINEYLFFLLKTRFEYLNARKLNIEATLSLEGWGASNILPTSKNLFDHLMSDDGYTRHRDFNELGRIYAVRRFELLNLLIKESFNSCTISELSSETIYLLRASIQLHPILTGQRQDLAHPDEAGGPYAVLEKVILTPKIDPHIKSLQTWLEVPSICHEAKKNYPENPHIATMKKVYSQINKKVNLAEKLNSQDKDLAHFNKIRRNLDLAVYEAHFASKVQFIPFKNIGTPREHGVNIDVTDYELGKWPYELPYPNFLKNPQEDAIALLQPNNSQEKKEIQQENTLPNKSNKKTSQEKTLSVELPQAERKGKGKIGEKIKSDQGKIEQAIKIVKEKAEEDDLTLNFSQKDQGKIEKESILHQKAIEIAEGFKQYEEEIKEIISKKVQANSTAQEKINAPLASADNVFNFVTDWVLPNGLRSFHSKMLHLVYAPCPLNSQYQPVVDSLFDNQRQCNVTFGEFQSLWKHIGGAIICGHGGSHRQLIGPQKENLFGIFAHSNNQTYGPRYIKYIQTAILYVGLRPAKELLR